METITPGNLMWAGRPLGVDGGAGVLHISGAGGSRGVCGCISTPQQGAKVDASIPGIPELACSTCVTGYLNILWGVKLLGTKAFLID